MNREQIKYKGVLPWATAVFLAALLLFAPCSVRNSIEPSLGFTISTAINKSKTAEVKQHSCISAVDQQAEALSNKHHHSFDAVFIQPFQTENNIALPVARHFPGMAYMGVGSIKIPLYILHNSFKFHL